MSSPEGSTVTFRRTFPGLKPRTLTMFARALQAEIAKGRSFDCLITGDAELRRLNRQFLGKDYPTDVLSFPADSPERPRPLGDIAISYGRARVQARRFGHTPTDEVRILMLHGVLHLMGFDHEKDAGKMARAERRWRLRLGLPHGLIERTEI